MDIDQELLDSNFLNEKFNLSNLLYLHNDVVQLKNELEKFKEYSIELRKVDELKKIEHQLYYVNRNINLIEEIIELKEMDIFDYTPYGEICFN